MWRASDLNYTGNVIAAISVSCPPTASRRSELSFRQAIVSAAKRIEERLGYYQVLWPRRSSPS